MTSQCETCHKPCAPHQLRPYGPNGSMICFDCGTLPANKAETDRRMKALITAPGHTIIDHNGIRKATTEEVVRIAELAMEPTPKRPN